MSKDGRKLHELTPDDTIATSSLRRIAALLRINKNFNIVDIRGNVNTRLRKMEEGHCDAMIMAAAGLQRLELDKYITEILDPDVLIPATSQGVIAIESRTDDVRIDGYLKEINHNKTWNAIEAERAFLHTIEGGCQVPVGCFTRFEEDAFIITGFVASVDGTQFLIDEETGTVETAHETGKKLAEKLREKGAAEILANIRKQQ